MGLILSVIDQNFPPQAKWSVDHVPDLTGKVALITGTFLVGYDYEESALLTHPRH